MIQQISFPWDAWTREIRERYKKNWVSSVELAIHGTDVYKLRKLCDNHPKFHALCIDISGTIKYWYAKEFINQMIAESERRKA